MNSAEDGDDFHTGGSDVVDRTEQRARVIFCVTTQWVGNAHDITGCLQAAGYEVESISSLGDIRDRVSAHGSAIILTDNTACQWLRLITDLLRDRPNVRPVVIGGLDSTEEFFAAIAAGVVGFCAPESSPAAIVRTVASVEQNGSAIPREMVTPLVEEIRHGPGHQLHTTEGTVEITDREEQILQLLLQRRSTMEMAEKLYVTPVTVRSHISTLLKKLGACDREDAIAMVERGSGATDV